MIRLFCSDFDQTLAVRGKIPGKNIAMIRRLQSEGVTFCLVTGRPVDNVLFLFRPYRLSFPIVATNGALLYQPPRGVISKSCLSSASLEKLIDLCIDRGWYYLLYGREGAYLPYHKWRMGRPWLVRKTIQLFTGEPILKIPGNPGSSFLEGVEGLKFNIYPGKDMGEAREILGAMPDIQLTSSDSKHLEIMDASVNKWRGVEGLMEVLELQKEEVAVIGDYDNDLPMIRGAGLSFAVRNASEQVKREADQLVVSCRKGGAGQAMEAVLKLNREER